MILFVIIITTSLFYFPTTSQDLSEIHCIENAADQKSTLPYLSIASNLTTSTILLRFRRSSKDNFVKDENPLLCPPCEQMHCFPKRKRRLQCKGGTTLDICNCCRVCAKLEGELCGGQHNYLGKCDRGLQCEAQAPQILHLQRDGVKKVYTITKGLCKKSPDMLTSDEGYGSFCRPKCTSEFCKENPKAICSATDNMEKKQDCQGPCQHTSCKACRFVLPEPKCLKCAGDDLKCLRRFGKCIQRSNCLKKQYPCKGWTTNKAEKGKFQCQIPECINS